MVLLCARRGKQQVQNDKLCPEAPRGEDCHDEELGPDYFPCAQPAMASGSGSWGSSGGGSYGSSGDGDGEWRSNRDENSRKRSTPAQAVAVPFRALEEIWKMPVFL